MQTISRQVWLASVVGSIVTLAVLIGLFNWHGFRFLTEAERRAGHDFVNTTGRQFFSQHESMLRSALTMSDSHLKGHPDLGRMHQTAVRLAEGSSAIKFRILSGFDQRTLFSTERAQIGEKKASNSLRGVSSSESKVKFQVHETFNSMRGPLKDANVASVEIPFYSNIDAKNAGRPDFLFEVYSDVSERIKEHQDGRLKLLIGALLPLLLLLGAMFRITSLADRKLAQAELERVRLDRLLKKQALIDPVTQIPNHLRLKRIGDKLRAGSQSVKVGLLLINLNRFKLINDSFGHKAGDRVLRAAAKRIRSTLGKDGEVFRLHGDEFVAVVSVNARDELTAVAESIVSAFAKPFLIDQTEALISPSIGITYCEGLHPELDALLRQADTAMYAAKRGGDHQFAFYHAGLDNHRVDQLAILTGLREALEQSQLVLHFQPRIEAITQRITCVEALLRWNHPTKGLLLPSAFIEVLEDSPLGVEVGNWVLKEACRQLQRWRNSGLMDIGMAVNIAARQFYHPDFIQQVRQSLADTGANPTLLEFEISEQQLTKDLEDTANKISQLKELGIRLSIDDFGTGHSALPYLGQLAIDVLKIDRRIVSTVAREDQRAPVAKAIISLAHSLQMSVVAKGVETSAQAQRLRQWGCEELQGFLFAKPLQIDDLNQKLEAQQAIEEFEAAFAHR